MQPEILEKQAIEAALQGKWEEAITINQKILSSGITSVGLYNRLGKAFSELSKWSDAVTSFKKALELDPINSVAEKGLTNAKNKKSAGSTSLDAHKETLIQDASTSQIIEIHLKNPVLDELYYLVPSKKPLFFLLVREIDGKKIKRINKSKLNLKQGINPKRIDAKIIEVVKDHSVQLKLSADQSIFKAERQQIDPSLQLKRKTILEEKKEIQKIFEEEREDSAI